MFCPNCGKDNSNEQKFCAACGTNLEAVAQALTGREEDFFSKMDSGIDQFLARYSEHVFRRAPQYASERRVARSWQVLGQSVVTTLVDILLFTLMWNLLPLRFFLLVISTPFRLLSERSEAGKFERQIEPGYEPPAVAQRQQLWLGEAASITEGTTRNLTDDVSSSAQTAPITDHLPRSR